MPEALTGTAMVLSHHLAVAMDLEPGADILGRLFCETEFYEQGQSFFPTPSEVSLLMHKLVSSGQPERTSFYEPCSGTGSIALQWIMDKFEQGGRTALAQCELHLEDVDRTMCQAVMLQCVRLLDTLNANVKHLNIDQLDVISRQHRGLCYHMSAKPVQHHAIQQSLEAIA